MANRVFNFNPGPATLPLEVLKIIQNELLDYRGTGMSVMELSHRSAEFDEINESAIRLAREVMSLPDNYHIVFLGGGASTQFAMVPMNFLSEGQTAAYVDTGAWSSKAIKEAKMIGNVHLAGSSKSANYNFIPKIADLDIPNDAAYLHVTSNNTIFGTEYSEYPKPDGIPLICDMSSDICSRKLNYTDFSMIYAGAQKNLGPSGVTLIAIKDEFLQTAKSGLNTMFSYKTHTSKKSLFNTPPAFSIYIVKLIFEWIKKQGGLAAIEKVNVAKKDRLYQLFDSNSDFFNATAEVDSRSWMNVTVRMPNEDLEKKFIGEAKAAGFIGLKGHRDVGGIRISIYNAMTYDGVDKVASFMESFMKTNG